MRNELHLDALDHEILLQLQKDGRLKNVELAKRVGLTPPPCLRRVKRLEDAGIISGYRAVIDPTVFGKELDVFVWIDVDSGNLDALESFERTMAGYDEVVECHRIFGRPDYFCRVRVRDPATYERFQTTCLIGLPAVLRVTSQLSMKQVKTM